MSFFGVQSFARTVYGSARAIRSPTSLYHFLLPLALRACCPHVLLLHRGLSRSQRQTTTAERPYIPLHDAVEGAELGSQLQAYGTNDIFRARRQRDPEAWAALLDQYLPLRLRATRKSPMGFDIMQEESQLVQDILSIMIRSRREAKVDLLSYVGLYEDRWEAVSWLMEILLKDCPSYSSLVGHPRVIPGMLWPNEGRSLNDMLESRTSIKDCAPAKLPLEDIVNRGFLDSGKTHVSRSHRIIGQIWQGLGCMILQAEDLSVKNPKRKVIMAQVLQKLADMHHVGTLPDSIYNYDPAEDKTVLQRPPTLYLLSARIMTALSDIAWKSHWAGEMEQAKAYGYDLPPPRVQPHLANVGGEVWLDLILWTCVQGGWIVEAAWLISEVERRRPNPSLQWSVISWDEICANRRPQLDLTAILKLQVDRTRLNQSTGIGIARNGTSSVEMGSRTISREVVLAIMDGLANITSSDDRLQGCSFTQIQEHLAACKHLLEGRQHNLNSAYLSTLMLRSIESSMVDARSQPGCIQRMLGVVPRTTMSRAATEHGDTLPNNAMLDFSAAILGLLHKSLAGFARESNLQGSLQAFRQIQDIVDANRDTHIQEFADELNKRYQGRNSGPDGISRLEHQDAPMLYPELPPYALAAFLDLIIETRSFGLGQWLLFNDDIDRGIMSPNLFAEPNLQPALLRFATSTADDQLFIRVLENLEMPLSHSMLHALLRCQVALRKWEAVNEILIRFRDAKEMAWTALDAMEIAAAIVNMETNSDEAHMNDIREAKAILQHLVRGSYNSTRNQPQAPDLLQFQIGNQLGRIYQSLPGALGSIELGPQGYHGRAAYSTMIHSDAFLVLMDAVVLKDGPCAGIRLWMRWCQPPTLPPRKEERHIFASQDGSERVIQPTLLMLRSILGPFIRDLKEAPKVSFAANSGIEQVRQENSSGMSDITSKAEGRNLDIRDLFLEESSTVLEWALSMYKQFGFSDEAIIKQFPEVATSLRRIIKKKV